MTEEKKGINEILEIIEALKELLKLGKAVAADGRVGYTDIALILGQIKNFSVYSAALKDAPVALIEAKDIDAEEAQVIIAKMIEIVAIVKA